LLTSNKFLKSYRVIYWFLLPPGGSRWSNWRKGNLRKWPICASLFLHGREYPFGFLNREGYELIQLQLYEYAGALHK
jgi:hypothetical protein